VQRPTYDESDYAFGQAMLTLRTSIGVTQAALAERLCLSRKAVGKWEGGLAYPKAGHLKALLAFSVKQQAFRAGNEEEEIRAFWKASHQKVLLDESWLSTLLSQQQPLLEHVVPPAVSTEMTSDAVPADGPRVLWGEALDVPSFYGREGELAIIAQWVVRERCRVVSVLGMGGIGKSALVTSAMRLMAVHFQTVIFRSLRDAPACETLVEEYLQALTLHPLHPAPVDFEQRLGLLLELLKEQRVLLVALPHEKSFFSCILTAISASSVSLCSMRPGRCLTTTS
jgi:transcriptional regulator with XRE-family HTH domain